MCSLVYVKHQRKKLLKNLKLGFKKTGFRLNIHFAFFICISRFPVAKISVFFLMINVLKASTLL